MANRISSKVETTSSLESVQSVTMTSELFEKLYLNPANKVSGDLRQRFGNPTPLALLGFLITSMPLAAALMGWRGAGGGGAGTIGTCYFFGGMLQPIGSLLEWIIGNTFSYIIFGSFAFTAGATTAAEKAAGIASYKSSLAFFLLSMGILIFMYLICSLRTNLVFFAILFFTDVTFFLLAGAYWKGTEGNAAMFQSLSHAAGATAFVFCMFGWYLLFAQLLAAADFPFTLPVFDLSSRILAKRANGDGASKEV
ncbi:Protein alcS [Cladobotryum mycophilum]|uniref:Protein alcS n=1 Tax=Cladobotryum mycophilum TaxID=491253 RepID=A0ABR0T0W0_9HYPO